MKENRDIMTVTELNAKEDRVTETQGPLGTHIVCQAPLVLNNSDPQQQNDVS